MPVGILPAYKATDSSPLAGLSPTWVAAYSVDTKSIYSPPPKISSIGGGLYRFFLPPTDDIVGLVDFGSTAQPRYVHYSPASINSFVVFDGSGAPKSGLSPTWSVWFDDVSTGATGTGPTIKELGNGMYYFEYTGSKHAAGIADFTASASDKYRYQFWQSNDSATEAVFPAFDTSYAPLPGLSGSISWDSIFIAKTGVVYGSPPSFVEIGGGLYKFTKPAIDDITGIIDLTSVALPQYIHYRAEDIVTFASYDSAGNPEPSLNPSWSVWKSGLDGFSTAVSSPSFVEVGGGIYSFHYIADARSSGIIDAGSGADERYFFWDSLALFSAELSSTDQWAADLIQLTFNEDMKNNTDLSTKSNYSVSSSTKEVGIKNIITGDEDSTDTVYIVVEKLDPGVFYSVSVNRNVQTASGNRIADEGLSARLKSRDTKIDNNLASAQFLYDKVHRSTYRFIVNALFRQDDLIGGNRDDRID